MVYRIYVEKRPAYAVEAKGLLAEIRQLLQIDSVTGLRLLNRYDVEGISEELFARCRASVFSEPQLVELAGQIFHGEDGVRAVRHGVVHVVQLRLAEYGSPAAGEQLLRQGQQHGQGLLPAVAAGDNVLQIHEGGASGLADQPEEGGKISPLQRRALFRRPSVVLEEVHRPEKGPVPAGGAHPGKRLQELLIGRLPQALLAQTGGCRAHFPRNGGVFLRQIRMTGSGVHDDQGVALPDRKSVV